MQVFVVCVRLIVIIFCDNVTEIIDFGPSRCEPHYWWKRNHMRLNLGIHCLCELLRRDIFYMFSLISAKFLQTLVYWCKESIFFRLCFMVLHGLGGYVFKHILASSKCNSKQNYAHKSGFSRYNYDSLLHFPCTYIAGSLL